MITIIATIKPEHLCNIRRGVKKYEMRKTAPKEMPFRVLCCESGSGGKIKAEFVCDRVHGYGLPRFAALLIRESCVTMPQAEGYAAGKPICFWHISEMIDYCSTEGYEVRSIYEFGLKRPPQSWQYVKDDKAV